MTALAAYAGAPQPTLITDVAVFLSNEATVDGPFDVYLEGGRIDAIRFAGDAAWRAERVLRDDAVEVDGAGMTLVPGLIDVHVHLGSTVAVPGRLRVPHPLDNAAALAWCGVTTVLDPGTPLAEIRRLRRRIDAGRAPGPSIYATGKPFAAPGGHPESTVARMFPTALGRYASRQLTNAVVSADDVDRAIAEEPLGEAVKVMLDAVPAGAPELSDAALARIAFAASALDKPVLAHVGRSTDVDRAVAMGAAGLLHAPYADAFSEAQLARLVELRIGVAPTLSVWQSVDDLSAGRPSTGPLAAEVLTDRQERDIADPLAHAPVDDAMWAWARGVSGHRDDRLANAWALYDSGGLLLAGSDTPFLTMPAGAGLHRELDLLVEAGLLPGQALRVATWDNRTFLDPHARFGAVREGWEADLVLVRGNPAVDADAIHDVVDVWIDGRRVERRADGR